MLTRSLWMNVRTLNTIKHLCFSVCFVSLNWNEFLQTTTLVHHRRDESLCVHVKTFLWGLMGSCSYCYLWRTRTLNVNLFSEVSKPAPEWITSPLRGPSGSGDPASVSTLNSWNTGRWNLWLFQVSVKLDQTWTRRASAWASAAVCFLKCLCERVRPPQIRGQQTLLVRKKNKKTGKN